MEYYYCLEYQSKYNTLKQIIDLGKDIFVYGSGNNGKTFIIDQILKKTNNNNYITIENNTNNKISDLISLIDKYKKEGKKLIIQSQTYLPFQYNNFVIINFQGKYNKLTENYE